MAGRRVWMIAGIIVIASTLMGIDLSNSQTTGAPSENDGDTFDVQFSPDLLTIFEGANGTVYYNISSRTSAGPWNVLISPGDPEIAALVSHDTQPAGGQDGLLSSGTFSVNGLWLGRTPLTVTVTAGPNVTLYSTTYTVRVLRTQRVVDNIFNIVLTIFIIMSNFMFGCLFDLASARQILRKPVAPTIGFLCQYTVMPTASFLLGWALDLSLPLRLGLLAVGCSPGGGNSNVWTLNLNGDVTLSLVMTFISNICALFMMPTWLMTLGKAMVGTTIDIPFLKIIMALCVFVFPILIGLAANKCQPRVGKFVKIIIRPWTLTQAAFVLVVGLWSNFYVFNFFSDWRLPVAGMLLPYIGMTIGMIVACIFQQSRARVITIGIETAFQNGAIALVVLRRCMQQPEADIASVAAIISAIFTPLPVVLAFIILTIKTKCIDRARKKGDYKQAPIDDTYQHPGEKSDENGELGQEMAEPLQKKMPVPDA